MEQEKHLIPPASKKLLRFAGDKVASKTVPDFITGFLESRTNGDGLGKSLINGGISIITGNATDKMTNFSNKGRYPALSTIKSWTNSKKVDYKTKTTIIKEGLGSAINNIFKRD